MPRPPAHLPRLLANLPNNGRAQLVRPAQWPKDSFYKVSAARLKFRQPDGGDVSVGAKAWGQVFWKGKLVQPRGREGRPDPRIRGGLKYVWSQVDPATLDEATAKAVAEADAILAQKTQERADALAAKRTAKHDRLVAAAAARKAAEAEY
ncbi:hypothetical protein Q8F55_006852 [Vanrija albida]|uniref:MRPL25 domain-containing protein n=1 Tax=Vanrija albida TaxID=181172 RepID=A0ABR3PY84_9TREE